MEILKIADLGLIQNIIVKNIRIMLILKQQGDLMVMILNNLQQNNGKYGKFNFDFDEFINQ